MSKITTRRALEIVLSRVRMHYEVSRCLVSSLVAERLKPVEDDYQGRDPDALRAAIMVALDHLSGAKDIPKAALHHRLDDAWKVLNDALVLQDGERIDPTPTEADADALRAKVARRDDALNELEALTKANETLTAMLVDRESEAGQVSHLFGFSLAKIAEILRAYEARNL